jgi:phage-related protein
VDFHVRFYVTEDGEKPVLEFLQSMRKTQPVLERLASAGLRKLEKSSTHGPPLTDHVDGTDGIYELRVGRADIARVFFFFQRGQEIICTNGYVKKSQKLDPQEVARANRYKDDWEKRHPTHPHR